MKQLDKYEYKLKLEQLKNLVEIKDYITAADIADSINWRKVKSAATLCMVGEIYDRNKRYDDSYDILQMAYDRASVGRNILYRLTLVCLKMGNLDEAREYYEEFLEVAPYDNQKYILRYQIAKLSGAGLQEQIDILEEFKEREYTEEWAFELAYLYHRIRNSERCVEVCDELVLYFGDGKYVEKALELKMLYQPLNEVQEEKYRQFKQEGPKVSSTEVSESDQVLQEVMQIPDITANTSRFNTSNLQAEIAKSMQQILEADNKEMVEDTMHNIKKIVEEIPYLQVPQEELAPEEESYSYIETDEEIDSSLRDDFREMLAEDWDGQYRMSIQGGDLHEPQVNGQMRIEDVLAEWERTKQVAETIMATAQQRRLESVKARALQETREFRERLNHIIPKLEAGISPQELLAERYLQNLPKQQPLEENYEEYPQEEMYTSEQEYGGYPEEGMHTPEQEYREYAPPENDREYVLQEGDMSEKGNGEYPPEEIYASEEGYGEYPPEEMYVSEEGYGEYPPEEMYVPLEGIGEGQQPEGMYAPEEGYDGYTPEEMYALSEGTGTYQQPEGMYAPEEGYDEYTPEEMYALSEGTGTYQQPEGMYALEEGNGEYPPEEMYAPEQEYGEYAPPEDDREYMLPEGYENYPIEETEQLQQPKEIYASGQEYGEYLPEDYENGPLEVPEEYDQSVERYESQKAPGEYHQLEERYRPEQEAGADALPEDYENYSLEKEYIPEESYENDPLEVTEEYQQPEKRYESQKAPGEYHQPEKKYESQKVTGEYQSEEEYIALEDYENYPPEKEGDYQQSELVYAAQKETDKHQQLEEKYTPMEDDREVPQRKEQYIQQKGPGKHQRPEGISTLQKESESAFEQISSWEEAAKILGEPIPEEYLKKIQRKKAAEQKSSIEKSLPKPIDKTKQEPSMSLEKLIEQQTAEQTAEHEESDAEQYLESVFRAAKASREEKVSVPKIKIEEPEGHIRRLSEEQKEIFSYFVPVTGMEQQLCQVLEGALHRKGKDNSSSSGNILIMGGRGSGKTVLATDLIKVIKKSGRHPTGRVGKITGKSLNGKELNQLIKKIAGGYLIIEKAGEISQETAIRLSLLMEQNTDGLLVIMEDTRAGIEQVLSRDVNFAKKFTERVKIPVFTSDELVQFAKAYAKEQECEIDDMGILALYNRISNIQKLDEATTLTEVKDIMDEAIRSADRGGLKKLFGRKKFSPEGYLYLREKDFED
ncbi:MAG: hypothetical protein HFI71_05315 [Lachnospiraceae bacterium]|nr:hypothetical protein [Lachnospiraceae bacterium]